MTGLFCPGCHTQFERFEFNDVQAGDIVICTRCAELGYHDGHQLVAVPMWSTKRNQRIVDRQVHLFAQQIDHTITRLLHQTKP